MTLRGLTSADKWRTAPAKAYPPALCDTIGRAFLQEARSKWPHLQGVGSGSWAIPTKFAPFWVPTDPFLERAMGADFARGRGPRGLPPGVLSRVLSFSAGG